MFAGMPLQTSFVNELAWTCCLFLGAVFLLSGVLKMGSWRRFRDTLTLMELVPRSWTSTVVWWIVILEVALGLNLILMPVTQLTGAIVIVTLALFICILGQYRWRGNRDLACGCFADFERKTPVVDLIIRNLLLVAMALPLVTVPRVNFPGWQALHWILAAVTSAGLWLAWKGINQLKEILALQREEASAFI